MTRTRSEKQRIPLSAALFLLIGILHVSAGLGAASAQERGSPSDEWRYWGGDAGMTRYAPFDQIDASNFGDLEVAWLWRGDNFGPEVDFILRSTPLYANGKLFTVAGIRRTVAAIDPATGETLWTFREPHTRRFERSPRQNYGKGVTYGEIDGRGVIYYVSAAFFLHALDAETGQPLEGFGAPVPIPGFGATGTVDLLADLGHPYDPETGIPASIGMITNSSPPMLVNGVLVVGNSHQTGRLETREENVPGDILAYDARTGRHLWKFNVIPQPGEFGHDTWENDAWSRAGNLSSWAPMSADLERGIVYVPTDPPTSDYYGGFHPGNNLFGTSILAIDVQTGSRVWHFQTVHHDIWDWDNPVPPILLDVNVNGQRTPIAVQTTKQGSVYTFNRVTGEPIWPIEERPVPQSTVPGEQTSPTQPFPTRPAAYELQGLREDDLVDFTPELRQRAIDALAGYSYGPTIFIPPVHRGNPEGFRAAINCPSSVGGTNIIGGTVADPESGIMYVAHVKACNGRVLIPGEEADNPTEPNERFTERTGTTVARWVDGGGGGFTGNIEGIPIVKPPYGRITAIDMNTGEHLWWIPNGDTPDRIRNHPLLQGVELPNTGQPSHATAMVTKSLLMYGEGRAGLPRFHAVDKRTGERLGTVDLPGTTDTAPMTFMHEGRQYIVAAVSGRDLPGSLVALRLPQ